MNRKWLKELLSITLIYSFDTLEIITGFLAVQLIPYTKLIPWILILLPIFLTIRGSTSGAFIGNLTTRLHIGTILPHFRENTDEYYTLAQSIFFLSVSNAFIVSFVLALYVLDLLTAISALMLVLLVFTTAILFSLIITSFIGFNSFKKGLDPDVIVYPIMSTINDIAILLFFIGILKLLKPWNPKNAIYIGTIPAILIISIYLLIFKKIKKTPLFKEIFKESYGTIIYSLTLSTAAGIILSSQAKKLAQFPTILTILPVLMTTIGDGGSITASTFTTKLRISGLSEKPLPLTLNHVISMLPKIGIPFLFFSTIISAISCLLNTTNFTMLLITLSIVLLGGFTSIIIITALSTGISIISFLYGINPDNVAIPILTATADFITILSISIIIIVIL